MFFDLYNAIQNTIQYKCIYECKLYTGGKTKAVWFRFREIMKNIDSPVVFCHNDLHGGICHVWLSHAIIDKYTSYIVYLTIACMCESVCKIFIHIWKTYEYFQQTLCTKKTLESSQ